MTEPTTEEPEAPVDDAAEGTPTSEVEPDAGGGGDWVDRLEKFLRRPGTIPFGLIVLIASWWFVRFSQLVIQRHNNFASFDFDSGIFDQAAWLSAHGAQFDTVRGLPLYGHHATFGFYLFAPFYWLGFDGPTVMNVAQVLALAVVPLIAYWVARRVGLEPWIACLAAFVCLAHFSNTWLAQELFHPEVFAIAPLLAAFGFSLRHQTRPYWACLLFAIIWKEDVALAILGLGIVLMLLAKGDDARRQRKLGLYTAIFAAVWFAVATQILLPHFSPTGKAFYAEGFYGNLGNNFTSVAFSFVSHPGRVATHLRNADSTGYLAHLWAPFAFVNLLAPVTLIMAIPQLLANLLSVNNFTWSLRFHYVALPLVASMIGFMLGLGKLRGHWRTFAAGLALAASLSTAFAWGVGPRSANYKAGYWPLTPPQNKAALEHAVSLIPANASVSASYHLVPHLSSRKLIFSYPNPFMPRNWGINDGNQRDPKTVQWLIIEKGDLGESDQQLLSTLIGPNGFRVVYQDGDVMVAKRPSA